MKNHEMNLVAAVNHLGDHINSVSLADHQMVTENVARVVIATTGDFTQDTLAAKIAKLFKGYATPIRNSFRQLTASSVTGFVSSVQETRIYEEASEAAKYKLIATNILMDKEDETTWEMKESAGGKYLVRQGFEDLSELARHMSHRRVGAPTLASVQVASVSPREFVAFVDTASMEMDYGMVVAATKAGLLEVVATRSGEAVLVDKQVVVSAVYLDAEDQAQIKAPKQTLTAATDKKDMIDYYKQAYPYSKEYIDLIVQQINSMAVA